MADADEADTHIALIDPTADGEPHDPAIGSSIFCVLSIAFLDSASWSIVIPSLYLYFHDEIKVDGAYMWYGWTISANSMAQSVFSPLIGLWSYYRPYREVFLLCNTLSICGNLLYSLSPVLAGGLSAAVLVVVSRTIVGVVAGSSAVVQAYISEASSVHDRSRRMTYYGLSSTLGFIIGTVIGAAVSFFPQTRYTYINNYTAVGYAAAILTLLNMVQIMVQFKELEHSDEARSIASSLPVSVHSAVRSHGALHSAVADVGSGVVAGVGGSQTQKSERGRPVSAYKRASGPWMAVVVTFLFFTFLCMFTVFETIATPLTHDIFNWDQTAVNMLWASAGVLGIVVSIVQSLMTYCMNDSAMLVFSSCLATLTLLFFTTYITGSLSLVQFICATVFMTLAFVIGDNIVPSIFSKLLRDGEKQSQQMGYFNVGGSAARTVGPIFTMHMYDYFQSHEQGASVVFVSIAGLMGVATILILVTWRELFWTEKNVAADTHTVAQKLLAAADSAIN
eukprot:gnl/Spiro4/21360_TR10437_c0_g1_i1.p1 gnl/Spiro4/21360_TR10437_c0_g1~~gnl/Spiro4/21360_TR10437_c0_g1_i1.p1  ORF type:complete len:507 (-),score=126.87 gnl/Spiro4/21360_TR10437_c0_g1_i1:191-1711(-)